ncbi:type II toxin-antitoxin system death-on-curing family toxin [Actinomadura sp. KC345]|uniref:type II toxin-antitoxin system death-on-curing family toxin n=1 Tax=Actinomadura sp. KC345 TaxID=2530371 RepID=UPI001051F34B|nr:type II toxin-antitoxin system death-on-curing family toxin [Actinomadura sp. KC345]TDC58115.1 type II toxin-antitoxin system death-on-curing family toxin [Actinomadura sp. KC345]
MIYPTVEQVIGFNAKHLGGQPAVRDVGLVQSAVARPQTVAFGFEAYTTLEEKAAALLHSIICNHPFVDGNKRTAWAAMEIMLVANGHVAAVTDDQAFDLVIHIATSCSEIEVKEIAAALQVIPRPTR